MTKYSHRATISKITEDLTNIMMIFQRKFDIVDGKIVFLFGFHNFLYFEYATPSLKKFSSKAHCWIIVVVELHVIEFAVNFEDS